MKPHKNIDPEKLELRDIHQLLLGSVAPRTIGFAGRRVIEQTIKETIPENFQTSDYLLEHGMVDMVVHRKNLREKLSKTLRILLKKN